MAFPSAARLDRVLLPYAAAAELRVRVWGTDAGGASSRPPSLEMECFGGPPRLVLLGAGGHGLVVVRQTRDELEDLDGVVVPWAQVLHLERDPHLVRDVVRVEVSGRAPLYVSVANHLLLPGNRTAAKVLCSLARGPEAPPPLRIEDIIPPYADARPA
jgi:hypothetical protein